MDITLKILISIIPGLFRVYISLTKDLLVELVAEKFPLAPVRCSKASII